MYRHTHLVDMGPNAGDEPTWLTHDHGGPALHAHREIGLENVNASADDVVVASMAARMHREAKFGDRGLVIAEPAVKVREQV